MKKPTITVKISISLPVLCVAVIAANAECTTVFLMV